jgi:predicted component of type VI protein secretion system
MEMMPIKREKTGSKVLKDRQNREKIDKGISKLLNTVKNVKKAENGMIESKVHI